jgi:hypothetical protein
MWHNRHRPAGLDGTANYLHELDFLMVIIGSVISGTLPDFSR